LPDHRFYAILHRWELHRLSISNCQYDEQHGNARIHGRNWVEQFRRWLSICTRQVPPCSKHETKDFSDFSLARADGIQGVIIERTRFNTAFDTLQPVADSGKPQFIVNQTTLNDQLINITMSVMMAYNQWSAQVNATVVDSVNVYSFSQPLVLILPYFISLAVALPFMILGFTALLRNGVSATDGGFMQIIATSTGSAVLDRAAAGGCLGGDENAPRELRELKIRFGEFVGRGDAGVKRAGFGVDGEVKPLRKGAQYGIARWI
jgi:hypothetical protein